MNYGALPPRCPYGAYYPPRDVFSVVSDLFKFWEITDNISETVQGIGVAVMED